MESLSAKAKESLLQREFRKYFRSLLDSFKVKSLKELTLKQKSKLFNTVKAEWKKVKKSVLQQAMASESAAKKAKTKSPVQLYYSQFFREKLLKMFKANKLSELSPKQKKKFFSSIKAEWPAAKKEFKKSLKQ